MSSRRADTRCESNSSTFNHVHQAAGYMKELQLKAGDTLTVVIILCWWCSIKTEQSFLSANKHVCFTLTTSDKHTQTFTSLKIVCLWMQMRKIHLVLRFHSRHTQSTHVFFTMKVENLGAVDTGIALGPVSCLFLNFSVLRGSETRTNVEC